MSTTHFAQQRWQPPINNPPLVSVITIFLNAEAFLAEAIQSVLGQTYQHWELLLVDDGSVDSSRAIADHYAERNPAKVRVLSHPGNRNLDMAASRNRGISEAIGKNIAFLDADDVWRPHKLEQQVAILESYPDAGMVYGETLYWYSWAGEEQRRGSDFIPLLRVPLDTLIAPPRLLPLFLRGDAAVPCTCSIMLKRSVVEAIGGFDESFIGIANLYEDQAFYVKVCLNTAVIASRNCWDQYRQHPRANTAVARAMGQELVAREFFLRWMENYLNEWNVNDLAVWQALQRELWRLDYPAWLPTSKRAHKGVRWAKKWLLRIDERLVPAPISARLWRDPL